MDLNQNMYYGTYVGTGAALNVVLGFQPGLVKIYDEHNGLTALWRASNPLVTRLFSEKLEGIIDSPVPQIGSTPANVANLAFRYLIAGIPYTKAAVPAGTAPGNDVIPQNKWGCVAFDIASDGTLDAVEATANATGYNSSDLAIAGLPAVGANHIRAFGVCVMNTAGTFTFATTSLATTTATKVYWDGTARDLLTTAAGITTYGDAVGSTGRGITLGTSEYINKAGATYFLEAYR